MLPDERNEFIGRHYGLVHSCCKRFAGRGIEYDDLYQAGSIGLIKAADGFDESYDVCFSTYAVPVILGEIKRLFRDGGSVKVSRGLKELSLKVSSVREAYLRKNGSEPTVSELSELLGVSEEEIAEATAAAYPVLSLTPSSDENGSETDIPIDESEDLFDRLTVKEIGDSLEENDRVLIGLRYFRGMTQSETARALGMSQVQVSRRERTILEAIRKKFA